MTDRLKGCTVVFERDIHADDAKVILSAIQMIKGVLNVTPSVSTPEDWFMREQIRREIGQKLMDIVYPKDGKG